MVPTGRRHKPHNECHNLLETKFVERVISRNGSVGWPPRSCALKPLDYFLSGLVKSMVYANKTATIDELLTNIEREISAVPADLGSASTVLQACPWWPCKTHRVSFIMASNVLLQE